MSKNIFFSSRRAYIMLLSTVIVMAILIIFLTGAQTIIFLGLEATIADRLSIEAYSVAESCLDDTLILLKTNSSYTGGSLNIADGYCTISVVDLGDYMKRISITGSVLNSYFQNIEADIELKETEETTQLILLKKYRN